MCLKKFTHKNIHFILTQFMLLQEMGLKQSCPLDFFFFFFLKNVPHSKNYFCNMDAFSNS